MSSKTVHQTILFLESLKTALYSQPDQPNFKEKQSFLNDLTNTLNTALEANREQQRIIKAQATHIDELSWMLRNEQKNKEDIKRQNSEYLHRMKSAGISYSAYQ